MTTLCTVTVNAPTPSLDKRAQEVAISARALEIAAQQLRSQAGVATSGTMTGDFGVVLGTWSYSPVASS